MKSSSIKGSSALLVLALFEEERGLRSSTGRGRLGNDLEDLRVGRGLSVVNEDVEAGSSRSVGRWKLKVRLARCRV